MFRKFPEIFPMLLSMVFDLIYLESNIAKIIFKNTPETESHIEHEVGI